MANFASEKQDEKKQKKESAHEKAWRAFLNDILKEKAICFEKRWIIQGKLQRVEYDGLYALMSPIEKKKILPDCIEILDNIPSLLEPGILLAEVKATLFQTEQSMPKINYETVGLIVDKLKSFFWPLLTYEVVQYIWTEWKSQRKVLTYFLIFVNGNDPIELKETDNIRKLFPLRQSETFVKDVLQKFKNNNLLPKEKQLEDFVRDLINGLSFGLYYCPAQTIVERMKDELVKAKDQEIEAKDQEIEAKDLEIEAKDLEIAALKKAKDDEMAALKKASDDEIELLKKAIEEMKNPKKN